MFSYSCVTPIIQIIQIIHFLYSITRYIDMQQIERNPAFGHWTEEETNWSSKDTAFMDAFEDYCGEKFYPHIVRSYYATKKAEEFINFKARWRLKEGIKDYIKWLDVNGW